MMGVNRIDRRDRKVENWCASDHNRKKKVTANDNFAPVDFALAA